MTAHAPHRHTQTGGEIFFLYFSIFISLFLGGILLPWFSLIAFWLPILLLLWWFTTLLLFLLNTNGPLAWIGRESITAYRYEITWIFLTSKQVVVSAKHRSCKWAHVSPVNKTRRKCSAKLNKTTKNLLSLLRVVCVCVLVKGHASHLQVSL